ncbi:MAG TPA: HAD family phosphatase, partial [Candidatus Saccharimonadales bacterium]
MIKGLIFDCYGVLVHGSLNYLRTLTPADKRRAFDDLSHASDRGIISGDEYVVGVGELIGISSQEVRDIIAKQEIRSTEMLELVKSLRTTYRTALLSNVGRGAIERLFSQHELEELFDVVVLSSEVGFTKPTREAYDITAKRLNLSPEECVMIDDILVNVEGAKAVGMQGILFKD